MGANSREVPGMKLKLDSVTPRTRPLERTIERYTFLDIGSGIIPGEFSLFWQLETQHGLLEISLDPDCGSFRGMTIPSYKGELFQPVAAIDPATEIVYGLPVFDRCCWPDARKGIRGHYHFETGVFSASICDDRLCLGFTPGPSSRSRALIAQTTEWLSFVIGDYQELEAICISQLSEKEIEGMRESHDFARSQQSAGDMLHELVETRES